MNTKAKPIINKNWDKTEQHWYRQFLKEGTVEQLAYTAVQEAHLRRKREEEMENREKKILKAIKQMSVGLEMLRDLLGFDLRKMAIECLEEEAAKIYRRHKI